MDRLDRKPLVTHLGALCCAVRFLTVVPLSWQARHDEELFPRSVFFFPLVGLLIGGGGVLLCLGAGGVLPEPVVAFVAVAYLAAISGFLHLDGLADSGDGLLSHRSREKSLAIMRDSRIGAMGVIVLLLVLLGKVSALSTLSLSHMLVAVFLMPVAGRAAIVMTMAHFPYGRSEGGLGAMFYSDTTRKAAVVAITLLAVCSWLVAGERLVLPLLLIVAGGVWGFGRFCLRRIGGVTGDTLGAICELMETTAAVTACALLH